MGRSPSWLRNSLLAGWALVLPGLDMPPVEVPAGTQLQIRLKAKIASKNSRPGDPVETIVIAPVTVDGSPAIPAGVTLQAWSQGPPLPPIQRCARRWRSISGNSKWAVEEYHCTPS
jgi:hypothetical protein